MRIKFAIAALVLLIGAIVVGCGDDDDDGGDGGGGGDAKAGGTVVVSSWGGAWTEAEKEAFGDPFTEETGIKVEYKVAGESPSSPALLQADSGNIRLDVINSENAELLRSRGLLAEFPPDLKSALEENANPELYTDDMMTLGNTANIIVCNPTVMERCPTTAEEFWDTENFPGPRAIMDQPEAAMSFALQADGVAPEDVYPLDLDRAISKLEEIKDDIEVWPASGDEQQKVLINEQVGAAIMWNGRAFVVKRDNIPELELYWDGAQASYGSGLVVMADGPNPEGAFEYLKWIVEHPEAQAQWTEALTYMTPAKDLLDLVPPDVAEALPSSHADTLIVEDDEWIVENSGAIQKAWQEFLAG